MTAQEFRKKKKWKYCVVFTFVGNYTSSLSEDSPYVRFFLFDVEKQIMVEKRKTDYKSIPSLHYTPKTETSFNRLMVSAAIQGIPFEDINFYKVCILPEVTEFLRAQKLPHFEPNPNNASGLDFVSYDET